MPSNMINDMEFEQNLIEMGDNQPELIRFIARQQFASSKILALHDTKIISLENGDRRISGIIGGISGTITAVVVGIISYFTNRS